jgi:hypothetical protein
MKILLTQENLLGFPDMFMNSIEYCIMGNDWCGIETNSTRSLDIDLGDYEEHGPVKSWVENTIVVSIC